MEVFIKNKRLLLVLFIIMILTQWLLPTLMIFQKNKVAEQGQTHLFKLAAIDPSDPFRGKYIILNPVENTFTTTRPYELKNKKLFATFEKDSSGFASIKSLNSITPKHSDYLEVQATNFYKSTKGYKVNIQYPFTRFYMNEHKAKAAEDLVREVLRNDSSNCYAVVKINAGESYLEDVRINETSLVDLLR